MNEAGKQKYEIAQCQSQEISLLKYVGSFLHSFYFYDHRFSSRIEKLQSDWNSVHSTFNIRFLLFQVRKICQNRTAGIVVSNISRSRPFFPGFLSVIYLLCIRHDEKITPL